MNIAYQYFATHPIAKTKQNNVLNAELLITGQFFEYAAKVYKGTDVDATELGWFIPRKKVNLAALLDSVLSDKAKTTEVYIPFNSQYKKLQEQLQFSKVERYYLKALTLAQSNETKANAFNNLGIVAWEQKDGVSAREFFKKAIAADPSFYKAADNLKIISAKMQ